MAQTTRNIEEQIVREAPGIEAYKLGLLESAKALANQPVNLPAFQVAGMTEDERNALAMGRSGIGAYQPYMTGAQGATQYAIGTMGEAADILRGSDTRAQFAPAQAATGLGIAATLSGARRAEQGDIAGYMNPYQQLVTQEALKEMNRQAQIQQQGLNAQAVRSGAFGGVREGVQRAELGRGLADIQSRRIFEDLAQNYAQAQNLYGQQAGRELTAGAQLGQLGQGIGGLAAQQYNIGQSMAGTLGTLGTQLGNLGVQQGALGETAQRLGQQDVQFLYNLGSQQRNLAQAGLDAARNTALQRAYEPYQRIGFLSDIYKGAPTSQISTTAATAPAPSVAQQVAGLTGAALTGTAALQKLSGI